MTKKTLKATHDGNLELGSTKIPCAVLEDGTRVLSEHGITTAMKSRSGASKRLKRAQQEDGAPLPVFIASKNLKSFICNELRDGLIRPIKYRVGKRLAQGYRAELLPQICSVWLEARAAGVLNKQQEKKCLQAEIIMRGLAQIGIIALVDEATGYQYDRDRDELALLLSKYLSDEKLKWAKMFPDEYYHHLYRLKGWQFPGGTKRSPLVGKITNRLVYEKLPPGVLEELRHRNPTQQMTGRRRWKHHQFLSADLGQPDLRDHLLQLIAIMRASTTWRRFERNFARAFPKRPYQPEMFEEEEDDE